MAQNLALGKHQVMEIKLHCVVVAMEDQVGQQRLGFERGRLGQLLVVIVDI